jgi:pimeloyl-ACP methyl ester carboxylesterase
LANRPAVSYSERGWGPPVVLLHAYPLSSAMWFGQLEALSDRYRVIAPDFPGFGGSSDDPGWTVDSAADMVAELCEELGVRGPVVVGGLSMGGYVALAFARRHPDRLRGLILADTKAEPDTDEAKANRDKMMAFAKEHGSVAVIDAMIGKMVSETTKADRPEVVAAVRQLAAEQSPDGIVAALHALRDRPDAVPGLGEIPVPTLVIVGADDGLTPPATARQMAAAIPKAWLEVLPSAGHLANLEVPEAFTAAVRGFLDGLA